MITDPKYPGWHIYDEGNFAGDAGDGGDVSVTVVTDEAPTVEIERWESDIGWIRVTVPPFVLAAQLRRLGWTVTEPEGGS